MSGKTSTKEWLASIQPKDDGVYFCEGEILAKLYRVSAELQGGSDRERDAGHRLMLLADQIKALPVDPDATENIL